MLIKAHLSSHNLLGQINDLALCEELKVRRTTCEVPDCNQQALYLLKHGCTVFICYEHQLEYVMAPYTIVKKLLTWMSYWNDVLVGAAFESTDDKIIVYQPQVKLTQVLAGKVDINVRPIWELLPPIG